MVNLRLKEKLDDRNPEKKGAGVVTTRKPVILSTASGWVTLCGQGT